jgi:hypothetical protein
MIGKWKAFGEGVLEQISGTMGEVWRIDTRKRMASQKALVICLEGRCQRVGYNYLFHLRKHQLAYVLPKCTYDDDGWAEVAEDKASVACKSRLQ